MARTSFAHKSKDSIMSFICLSHIGQVMVIRRVSQQLSVFGGVLCRYELHLIFDRHATIIDMPLSTTIPAARDCAQGLVKGFRPQAMATGLISRVSPCPFSISPLLCGDAHFNTQQHGTTVIPLALQRLTSLLLEQGLSHTHTHTRPQEARCRWS